MPYKPGECGNRSGRPVGSKNKFSKLQVYSITQTLNEMECNPFQILADLALNARSEKVRCEAAIELCQYIEPKLKSIEYKGDKEIPIKFILNLG